MMPRELPVGSRSTGFVLKCYISSMRIVMMFFVLLVPSVAASAEPKAQVTEKTKAKLRIHNPMRPAHSSV